MRCDMKCKMWVVKCKTGARTSIASDTKGNVTENAMQAFRDIATSKKSVKKPAIFHMVGKH